MAYSKKDHDAVLPDPSPPYIEKIQYDPKILKKLKKIYILWGGSHACGLCDVGLECFG